MVYIEEFFNAYAPIRENPMKKLTIWKGNATHC
jgi:hypothetical protein